MTDLERIVSFLWMMGVHIAQSSSVKRGEIVLCKNGKPVRYAPHDVAIDWNDDDLTSFVVADERYDLVLMNNYDHDEFFQT